MLEGEEQGEADAQASSRSSFRETAADTEILRCQCLYLRAIHRRLKKKMLNTESSLQEGEEEEMSSQGLSKG